MGACSPAVPAVTGLAANSSGLYLKSSELEKSLEIQFFV